MATHPDTVQDPVHPAPAQGGVSTTVVLLALLAGPAAWITQLVVNYGLASYSCYPRWRPAPEVLPGWHGIWWGQLGINLIAVVVALVATALCWRAWRRTRGAPVPDIRSGRMCFLALVGVMTGLGFVAATLFDTVMLLGVPQCLG